MIKLTLDFEEEYDFDLIGICSHIKDYRLVWELNHYLQLDFEKKENYDINHKGEQQSYSFFECIDKENAIEYFLINNRSDLGYLIPEEKSCDYLLVIKGNYKAKEVLLKKISQIRHVLTTYVIDVEKLKSKDNLLF